MGYVAVRGGEAAIRAAADLSRYLRLRGARQGTPPLVVEQVRDYLRLAVDRVMAEGSLYAPFHAALALKQAEGDTLEAAFLLRAFRSTQPRIFRSEVVRTDEMRLLRRISAAFKDVPQGQVLGPTRDYTVRLLDFSLTEEDESAIDDFLTTYLEIDPRTVAPPRFPRVLDILRAEGLLRPPPEADAIQEPLDITREALRFPAPRSAKLQALARGETGGLLALAYSSMRGHGYTHPVVGELRVGHVPLRVYTPGDDVTLFAGEVLITEAEVISATFTTDEGGDPPSFSAGYGLCFGHNEVKAIAMAVLDRSTSVAEPKAPAEDTEFVLLHTDGIESSGFAAHYKLPHYVTFQSYLDRLRTARAVKPEVTR